jgi:hypothetical protein
MIRFILSDFSEYNALLVKTDPFYHLKKPYKVGTLALAKFTEDNCWYRARITAVWQSKDKGRFGEEAILIGFLEICMYSILKLS